jgi:hypothetical protein
VNVPGVLFIEMATEKGTADAAGYHRNWTADCSESDNCTATAANGGSNKSISTAVAVLVLAVIIVMSARYCGFRHGRCNHHQRRQGESDFASHNASPRTVHMNAYLGVWLRERRVWDGTDRALRHVEPDLCAT